MRVEDSSQFSKLNLKLKNERDRVIQQKKVEIEKIKENYNQQSKDQRIIGAEKLDAIRDQNQMAILETLDHKEARLTDIKKSLEETQKQFSKQENFSKNQFDNNISAIRDNYQQQLEYVHEKGREELADTTDIVNELAQKIKYDNEDLIIEETAKAKTIANEMAVRNDGFISNVDKQFKRQVASLEKENKVQVKGLEKDQRQEMSRLKSEHFQKLSQNNTFNQNELKAQKAFHEDTVKGRKDAFESKYATLQKEHQSLMGRLKAKIDEELNSLKTYYTKARETISNKAEDQFYNITKIEPQIKQDEKFYYFSIEVPKHEEPTVHINAQERNITVTQNRRFDQRVEENGDVFKSKRSESLIKEFKVPDILDGAKVTRNYDEENATLTYRIAKR